MAVVKNPLMSEKARGSVEGVTFSSWRGMAVAKRKSRPVRRRRSGQPRARSLLGFLSRYWGDLTDVQREAWRDYAANHPRPDKFGGTFQMTGSQAFTSLNHQAIRLGGYAALLEDPPASDPPASVDSLGAEDGISPVQIVLTWTLFGTPVATDFNEVWESRPYLSPGRVEIHEQYRFLKSNAGDDLEANVSGLQPGMWYWFQVRYVDEFGQVTAWVNVHHQCPAAE
jgi:hypothetical protein